MRELLVNIAPGETRAALVEDGVLQELQLERSAQRGLVGNLYKGRIVRVLPGMQAAFVDIGLARTGFLHAGDIAPGSSALPLRAAPADPVADADANADAADADAGEAGTRTATRLAIDALVSEGDELLVQVIKDPIGGKGARLSSYLSLASRLLVYLPYGAGVGISARISAEPERNRLRTLLQPLLAPAGGYIVRTAAEHASAPQLGAEMAYLQRLWQHVRERRRECRAGTLVHEELPLALRVLRDELSGAVTRLRVDCAQQVEPMRAFAAEFMPQALPQIEHHQGPQPLFDQYGIDAQIGRALERKVPLDCGGYLVIDQTEALTTIDVNTGAYVGQHSLEETSLRTNCEAALAIAQQLRLRNIGGIIVIDFIDMELEEHRQQLLAQFQAALAGDRARSQLAGVSSLGLVEMTRKRTRESLGRLLCEPCSECEARGFRKSPESVARELYREVLRRIRPDVPRPSTALAHPRVIEWLQLARPPLLPQLEQALGRPLRLTAQALNGVEHYEVICD